MFLDKGAQAAMNAHKRLRDLHLKKTTNLNDYSKKKKSKIMYSYHYECMSLISEKKRKLTKKEKKEAFNYAKSKWY